MSAAALLAGLGLVACGCSSKEATEEPNLTGTTEQALKNRDMAVTIPTALGEDGDGTGWVFYFEENTINHEMKTDHAPSVEAGHYRDIMQKELLEGWQSASKLEFFWGGSRQQPCSSSAECESGQTCGNISACSSTSNCPGVAWECTSLTSDGTFGKCATSQTVSYCSLKSIPGRIGVVVQVDPDSLSWCFESSNPVVHLKKHRTGNGYSIGHEFGHAIGFQHEQDRADYTDSSKVNLSNTFNTPPDAASTMNTKDNANNKMDFWDRVGAAAKFGRRVAELSPMTTWCRVAAGGNCYANGLPGLDYATIAANRQESLLQGTSNYVPNFANGWLWDVPMPGTVALNLYLNPTTGDYLTATSTTGLSGYSQTVGAVGYIYSSPQPGTIALKLYKKGNDYLTTADTSVQTAAQTAGYALARTDPEGYVFGQDLPYRILQKFARWDYVLGNPTTMHPMSTAVGLPLQADLLEDAMVPGGLSCSSARVCAPGDTSCVPRPGGYCPNWQTPYQTIGDMPIVLGYQVQGTIPFETYYSNTERQYFGCAASCKTDAQKAALVAAGYQHIQTEGYVFETDQFNYSFNGVPSSALTHGATGKLGSESTNTIEGYGLVNEGKKGERIAAYKVVEPQDALYASNSIKLNDRTQVKAAVGQPTVRNAGGSFTSIGVEAKVGAVQSVASVDLKDRSSIAGFIESTGTVAIGNNVTHSSIANNRKVDAPSISWFTKSAAGFPTTSLGDVNLEPGQASANTTFTPGRRGTVMVKSNTVLTLSTGNYYFDALYNEGTIKLNTTNGPVRLYIANTFLYTGKFVDLDERFKSDLFIGYFGTAELHINASLVGTIIAPNAKLTLSSASAGYKGAFYAKDVEVHQDNVVTYLPFLFSWTP